MPSAPRPTQKSARDGIACGYLWRCDPSHNFTLLGSLAFTLENHLRGLINITDILRKPEDDRYIEFNRTAMHPVQLLPGAISEILASVTDTGVLTLADRYGLMAATFDDSLNDEDRGCVNRLLRAVLRGRVKVVNELSAAF